LALNAPVAPVTQNGQAISRYAGPGAGIGRLAKPIAVDPRISQAKALMYWAMGRKFPLGELAGMLGLSSSRLSHLFRSEVGMSPERYLKAARLARAKALLETSGLSVKQAGGPCRVQPHGTLRQRFSQGLRAHAIQIPPGGGPTGDWQSTAESRNPGLFSKIRI